MPGRNDPCPCGSGKKYKHCHLDADTATPLAVRVVRGTGVPGVPPGSRVRSERWEADLVPYEAQIANDPAARPTVLMVSDGNYVLSADVLTHPPAERDEVARLLADAVAAGVRTTGVRPQQVAVRLESLVDPVAELLADDAHPAAGARVVYSRLLPLLDDAIANFEARNGLPPLSPGERRMSFVETYAGWGIAPEVMGRFFSAAAAYFRTDPWSVLHEEDIFTFRVRGGGTWYGYVSGVATDEESTYGLTLFADLRDLRRLMMLPPERLSDAELATWTGEPEPLEQAIISVDFRDAESLPRTMRAEVKRERWTLPSRETFPLLVVENTPGGGITTRKLEDLIAALLAVPGFMAKHAESLAEGAAPMYPLRFTDVATGTAVDMAPLEE